MLTPWRVALLGLGAAVLAPPPIRAEKLSLAQVIGNVEANEQLYHDIEVIATADYQFLLDGKDEMGKLVRHQTKRRRSVTQGTMFYLQVGGGHELLDEKSYDLSSLYGYDGEATRQVQAGGPTTDADGKHQAIVNVNHKRLNPCDLFLPHTWIVYGTCTTPLSVFLRGGGTLANHPGGHRYKNTSLKTFLEGEEDADGLRCVKLRCDCYDIQGAKEIFNTRRFLWLAIERNYLPVKTTSYVMFEDPTTALEVTAVKDFHMIAPDVWLPFEKESVVYDHIIRRTDKTKMVVRHREVEKIELAKLDPKYDKSFFRDIAVPDRAAVYEIKGDKIVNEHLQVGTPPAVGRRRWTTVAAVVLLLVGLCLVFFRLRRRGRAA